MERINIFVGILRRTVQFDSLLRRGSAEKSECRRKISWLHFVQRIHITPHRNSAEKTGILTIRGLFYEERQEVLRKRNQMQEDKVDRRLSQNRSLLIEWTWHELSLARATRSLARALTIALRASKQSTRQRFALFELDL